MRGAIAVSKSQALRTGMVEPTVPICGCRICGKRLHGASGVDNARCLHGSLRLTGRRYHQIRRPCCPGEKIEALRQLTEPHVRFGSKSRHVHRKWYVRLGPKAGHDAVLELGLPLRIV
jgi:hypothetical protein